MRIDGRATSHFKKWTGVDEITVPSEPNMEPTSEQTFLLINIARGEMLQSTTPLYFYDNFTFFVFYHKINCILTYVRSTQIMLQLISQDNFYH